MEDISKTFKTKLMVCTTYYGRFSSFKQNRIFGLFNWGLIKWTVKKYESINGSCVKPEITYEV